MTKKAEANETEDATSDTDLERSPAKRGVERKGEHRQDDDLVQRPESSRDE